MNRSEKVGQAIAKWALNNPRIFAFIAWSVVVGIFAGGAWMIVDRFREGKVFSATVILVAIVITALAAKRKSTETPE